LSSSTAKERVCLSEKGKATSILAMLFPYLGGLQSSQVIASGASLAVGRPL
jgi:hypothetical protein